MELHIKEKVYPYILTNRRMVAVLDALGAEDISDVIFTGAAKNDLRTLAVLVAGFTDAGNAGQALDLLDDYRSSGHTFRELYADIARALNEEYFFETRMTDGELAAALDNPLRTLNLDDMVRQATEDAVRTMAAQRLAERAQGK